MKKLGTALLAAILAAGTAHAAGPWEGSYSVKVTGENVSFDRQPALRRISDTTTMSIKQTGKSVSVTFGTFASAMATTAFKGRVGNGRISANWWFQGKPNELSVLWGTRKGRAIHGELFIPRTSGRKGLVAGWTKVRWTATPTRGGKVAGAVKGPTARIATDIRLSGKHLVNMQRRGGIDPAAVALTFRIVNKTSQFNGRVQITGVVKNVGSKPFLNKGRPGAAAIHLYEGNRLVANRPMRDLQPGATQRVTYTRNWRSSSPSEGEFPPTYKLWIMYDPDITLDSNPDNDDSNSGNNRKQKSGAAINTLFRGR